MGFWCVFAAHFSCAFKLAFDAFSCFMYFFVGGGHWLLNKIPYQKWMYVRFSCILMHFHWSLWTQIYIFCMKKVPVPLPKMHCRKLHSLEWDTYGTINYINCCVFLPFWKCTKKMHRDTACAQMGCLGAGAIPQPIDKREYYTYCSSLSAISVVAK